MERRELEAAATLLAETLALLDQAEFRKVPHPRRALITRTSLRAFI